MEDKLKDKYEQAKNSASVGWEHAKDATRAAYDKVTQPGSGNVVHGSTRDQVAGNYNQAAGAVKEKTGEVFGDRELQAKGVMQNLEGKAEEGMGGVKKEFGA